MTTQTDIGTRIELVPMDGHFHDISVALYRQQAAGVPAFVVHSYSGLPGAGDRLRFIGDAMAYTGGLAASDGQLCFPCGAEHNLAVRRAFLEACKLDPSKPLVSPPLTTTDRKSGLAIRVESLGEGQYRVLAEGDDPDGQAGRRIGVIVNGLLKLGDMRRVEEADGVSTSCVGFDCGHSHDGLVGLLLQRAPNVRAIVREQEAMAARGVLSAPSAQE